VAGAQQAGIAAILREGFKAKADVEGNGFEEKWRSRRRDRAADFFQVVTHPVLWLSIPWI
jgi:hypothetical protein